MGIIILGNATVDISQHLSSLSGPFLPLEFQLSPNMVSAVAPRDGTRRIRDSSSPTRTPPTPRRHRPGGTQQLTMSSILDAVLHSDAAATPASTAGGPTPRSTGFRSSSARPRGPPSESNAAHSDIEAFPDDEVVGARGGARRPNGPRTDIPKVVDVTGETLSLRFQEFLEK